MTCYRHPVEQEKDKAESYLDLMLSKSFETIPGELYNGYRYDVLKRFGHTYLFYEISLMEEKPWPYLRDWVYPNFVRYTKAKGLDPRTAEGIVVAIFCNNRCHLIRGEDFLSVFREVEGLDYTEFRSRVARWVSY